MTSKCFPTMAVLVVLLMLTAPASAEFDEVVAVAATTTEAEGFGFVVTDLYATGNVGVGHTLLSVGNADITATHDWYQDPNGDSSGKAPNNVLVDLAGFERLKYDTYVTFNRRTDTDNSTSPDPDFGKAGNQIVGGWFWVPGNGQGDAVVIEDLDQVGVHIARLVMIVDGNRGGLQPSYVGTLRLFTSSDNGGDPDGVLVDVKFPPGDPVGACCNGSTGMCRDDVLQSECLIDPPNPEDQITWFKGLTCVDATGEPICVEHTGACCDGTTGTCTDGIRQGNCQGDQLSWSKDTLCDAVTCLEHTGACCDGSTGICADDVRQGNCQGDQLSWFKNTLCDAMDCVEHTGACCDGTDGTCTDDVFDHDCVGDQQVWSKDTLCSQIDCLEHTGACCDGTTGICADDVRQGNCQGDQSSWFKDTSCDAVDCVEHTGACCDGTIGTCTDNVFDHDCVGDQQAWSKGLACDEIDCVEHTGACCHAATTTCFDGVFLSQCPVDPTDPNNQFSWSKGLTCLDGAGEPICVEHAGACCDGSTGTCVDRVFDQECQGDQQEWFKNTACDSVPCIEHTGACCEASTGTCFDNIPQSQCPTDPSDPLNLFSWRKGTLCEAIDNCECDSETIGGAIYTDCDSPLTSGEDGVELTVSGLSGFFTVMTSGPSGTWHILDVPCGEYTVTAHQVFREYCHVDIGGVCPPEPCPTSTQITVDADHRTENLSIQFLGQPACITNDLNYDEVCTIVNDTDLFVQCVYDGDCVGPEGQDLRCPADCNCDGFATIVFDANCFVHDVYVKGVCGQCPGDDPASAFGRSKRRRAGDFTIGGAVYDNETNPLLSGIEGVNVEVLGAERRAVAAAMTAGPSGIWRVDGLPAGTYFVVVEHRNGRAAAGRDVIPIVVNAQNEAANLSIRSLRSSEPPRRSRDSDR